MYERTEIEEWRNEMCTAIVMEKYVSVNSVHSGKLVIYLYCM
jgi:hypothetical protein